MKTDVITVSSKGARMEKALTEVEKVCRYKELTARQALHLRLLTEEMMGMMRSITGETEGEFWIEDKDNVYELHLCVETRMNSDKRDKLLAASTSGKNESAKGLMGRLRDFFDRGADEDVAAFSTPLLMPGLYEGVGAHSMEYEWSMIDYVEAVKAGVEHEDKAAVEAWDELEKSVVSHVADNVKVSIKGSRAELIIVKKFA